MWLGLRGPTPPRGSHLPPARKLTYCKLQGICFPRPLPQVSGHRLWAPEKPSREGLWAPARNSGHHLGVCSSTRQSPVVAASLAPGEGVAGKAGQPVIAATSLVAATVGRQGGIRNLRSPFPSRPPSRSPGSGGGASGRSPGTRLTRPSWESKGSVWEITSPTQAAAAFGGGHFWDCGVFIGECPLGFFMHITDGPRQVCLPGQRPEQILTRSQ